MPVCCMKSCERPGESRERNTAIHNWIFLDICGVIKGDELVPDHLRIKRKRHHRQTQQDEKIGSPECWKVAEPHGAACVRCNSARGFSFSRCSFGHALCETTTTRATDLMTLARI